MIKHKHLTSKLIYGLAVAMLFIALNGSARADTIWAVVVADTNDPHIGYSVGVDAGNVTRMLDDIAKQTDMDLKLQTISGNAFTAKSIDQALNNIKPGTDDVVFFYYSGHGERDLKSSDPWPEWNVNGQLVPYSDVLSRLDNGAPRLVIALSDACNRDLRNSVVGATIVSDDGHGSKEQWSYKDLFKSTTGYFVASSASPGELSTVVGEGSAFTKSFLNSVTYAMRTAGVTWQDIKEITGQPIPVLFKENNLQTAFTKMDIRGLADPEPHYPF
ncbi:MAG: caspase family protein [Pseudomonadota bacterium]